MKSSEIAREFGISEYKLTEYIKKNATFSYKENFWGEITVPDSVDIDRFLEPLLRNRGLSNAELALRKHQQQIQHERQQQEELKRKQESYDRQEQLRYQQEDLARKQKEEQYHLRIESLREKQLDGYYEYKVVSLLDIGGLFSSKSGRVNTVAMAQTLNELGVDGWRLVTAYSNELGKNALSGGAGGILLGTNSTVDENILIFERFVKI